MGKGKRGGEKRKKRNWEKEEKGIKKRKKRVDKKKGQS